jgi:DNA-binding CsgD family transcriptional regulator
VDLRGRLSNPPKPVETLAEQELRDHQQRRRQTKSSAHAGSPRTRDTVDEETGQRSNPPRRPVQRRLTDPEIDELVNEYQAGRTLADLACALGIDRPTVAAHLQARGIQRRINRRKMTDDDVSETARRYRAGDSLATIASTFNVDAATIRHELHRIGVDCVPWSGGESAS